MCLLILIKIFIICFTISSNTTVLISFKSFHLSDIVASKSRSRRSVLCLAKQSSFSETFYCENCGTEHIKWVGRCTSCKEWNSIKMIKYQKSATFLPTKNKMKDLEGGTFLDSNIPNKFSGNSWVSEHVSLTQLKEIDCDIAVQRSVINAV